MHQRKFVRECCEKFNITRNADTPAAPGMYLDAPLEGKELSKSEQREYQRLCGCLNYFNPVRGVYWL